MQLPDVYVINESFLSEACIIKKWKNLTRNWTHRYAGLIPFLIGWKAFYSSTSAFKIQKIKSVSK
jgi:hypothetical protein